MRIAILIIAVLLSSCAAKTKPVTAVKPEAIPIINMQAEPDLYYELWIEAEEDLRNCQEECGCVEVSK